jgi:uncharacterized membrane protein YbaN (DUF454 family)
MRVEPSSRRLIRLVFFWCGIFFTFIGIIGLIFPIIPGFVFFIPAAFCFAKSSASFNRKIKSSKRFGKYFE